MFYGLSKSRLMAFKQCPKRLWLYVHRHDLQEFSEETEQRFQIGFQVGDIARSLHPDGILIEGENLVEALELTRQALAEHPDRPLFEATFQRDNVLVRADVLLPEVGGYRLREVKASTKVKDEHYKDCAIQAWVIGGSVTITGVELAHVDNTFVYPGGGHYQGLLKPQVLDTDLADLLPRVPDWIAEARAVLAGTEPAIVPGDQCSTPYDCPFQNYCIGDQPQVDYPLSCLPQLQGGRLQGLIDLGIEDVPHIPDDYGLTENQARVARVIKSGEAERDLAIQTIMSEFGYPRYYLDFETTQVAVPIWPGTRPYQQLLLQWSCHVENAAHELMHHAFLAQGFDDPRRAFAEKLINTLGDTGPVFVYNQAFEATRLSELAKLFPDLKVAIEAIIMRIVDLLPLTRQYYCHPNMKGSWSIKAVLPTIAPELAYDDLEIGDGGAAMGAWREICHPDTADSRRAKLYADLAEYCALDTQALVRLAAFLGGA